MQKITISTENILKNLGIESLNEMQKTALETCEKNNDVVLLAPTGSGKTLAFLLPILQHIDVAKEGVQVLILAPSRELALQIEQVFRSMKTELKVNSCYGGHPMKIEKNNLKTPPAVLVGTPGRLADHIRRENFDTSTIGTIVYDEFDKALEFGFKAEMEFIVTKTRSAKRRILTSATESVKIPAFVGLFTSKKLNFLNKGISKRLTLKRIVADGNDKLDALFRLICNLDNRPTLVFCNHRDAVERISGLLKDSSVIHDIFHGGLEQHVRERALIKFRNGSHSLLITTDLASRGLDIPTLDYVVHYQMPVKEDAFIHRNGRTARMHAKGTSYLIQGQNERLPEFINDVPVDEKLPDLTSLPPAPEWTTIFLDKGRKDKVNKIDIVGLLLKKGKLGKDELGLIEVSDFSSFAAVKTEKAQTVVEELRNERIKKQKTRIGIAH